MAPKQNHRKQKIAVLGLGRYGSVLANELQEMGHEVIGIDHDSQVVKELSQNYKFELVGFHGQTIYHNAKEKISKQLGNGPLLSQLTKKKIVYNFRENDLKNGGQGAPLTPIFHKVLLKQKKNKLPAVILNIGGIANITIIENFTKNNFKSYDVGPGNCLIDEWIRKNSDKNFDKNGKHSSSGTHNEIILEQIQDNFIEDFRK